MEIRFRDLKIQDLCQKKASAVKKLGDISARKLRARLADLEAAATVSELVSGRPHTLKGNRAGEFALDLAGGDRICFSAAHSPNPILADLSIDWSKVTVICIEFIGDYHD